MTNGAASPALTFVVRRQGGLEIDFDVASQCLKALHEVGVYGLQAFRMPGDVLGQKAQKLSQHRVVAIGGLSAGKHHLATGADAVVDLVALAELKGATHRFRHRRLITVGQRGFGLRGWLACCSPVNDRFCAW